MVAAGRVHRMPMSERLAQLERIVHSDELTELLTERRRAARGIAWPSSPRSKWTLPTPIRASTRGLHSSVA